jgi:hypothetical protein
MTEDSEQRFFAGMGFVVLIALVLGAFVIAGRAWESNYIRGRYIHCRLLGASPEACINHVLGIREPIK